MDMDPTRQPRKVRFAPKKPALRKDKAVQTTTDVNEAGNEISPDLIRRFHESLGRGRPRPEPTPKQVAFEHVSATHPRTFGKPRKEAGSSADEVLKDPGLDNEQHLLSLPKTAKTDEVSESSEMSVDELPLKKKAYKDPWDYKKGNYPITLPLRRPNSGNPELLDEDEFGVNAAKEVYDENSTNVAAELGLLVESNYPQMIFFQLPDIFPRPVGGENGGETAEGPTYKGKEKVGSSSGTKTASVKGCSSKELPKGYMGKMLIYKSGAVKLKLGNILYDVKHGVPRSFQENVVAVNTDSKQFCVLGDLPNSGVVAPDVISMLDDPPTQ